MSTTHSPESSGIIPQRLRIWFAVLIAVGIGLMLLNRSGEAGAVEAKSPCDLLNSSLTSEPDVDRVVASFSLATNVVVPSDLSVGNFLCWDHLDAKASGEVDGVAITDIANDSVWLIVSPNAAADIDWIVILRDYGFGDSVATSYGFSNGQATEGTVGFWEKAVEAVA